jgi:triphosphatase
LGSNPRRGGANWSTTVDGCEALGWASWGSAQRAGEQPPGLLVAFAQRLYDSLMTANPDPIEIELKLHFPAEVRARLERHPALLERQVTPPSERRLVTTYYDTPDHRLSGKGYTLRVRRVGDERVQTLKSQSSDGAVAMRRGEWEWPVAADTPDLSLLAETPIGKVLRGDVAETLAPILTTDIRRVVRQLRLEDGAIVEAAVDEGSLRAGSAEQPVRELELELKDGQAASLYRLALALHADLPLCVETESKAARGYRLRTGQAPGWVKAGEPELGRKVTGADGFRRIIVSGLGALLANQAAASAGDPEGVHQMRVAVRRVRAALVLFAPALEPHARDRFEGELKRLGQVLGEARDWDVFCLETLPAVEAGPDAEVGLLQRAAEAERAAAHERLRRELAMPALTGLILALAAWVEDAPRNLGDGILGEPLADLAPKLLGRIARKVHKRGQHIEGLSGPDLHALRKSLKKLRYGVEYLDDLFPRKAVKAYIKRCKALQDRLGAINDARVATDAAARLSEHGRVELVPALAAVAVWSKGQHRRAMRRIGTAWDKFDGAPRFWR